MRHILGLVLSLLLGVLIGHLSDERMASADRGDEENKPVVPAPVEGVTTEAAPIKLPRQFQVFSAQEIVEGVYPKVKHPLSGWIRPSDILRRHDDTMHIGYSAAVYPANEALMPSGELLIPVRYNGAGWEWSPGIVQGKYWWAVHRRDAPLNDAYPIIGYLK